jgi:hypothetical protein
MQALSQVFRHFAFHRAAAAFFAIRALSLGVRASARAFPPFSPPMRPSATAAGFFNLFALSTIRESVARRTRVMKTGFGGHPAGTMKRSVAVEQRFGSRRAAGSHNDLHNLSALPSKPQTVHRSFLRGCGGFLARAHRHTDRKRSSIHWSPLYSAAVIQRANPLALGWFDMRQGRPLDGSRWGVAFRQPMLRHPATKDRVNRLVWNRAPLLSKLPL